MTPVPMGEARGLGAREASFTPFGAAHAELAEILAERDDGILAAYVEDDRACPTQGSVRSSLRRPGARSCIPSSSARH